jgi:hypothetical protein
VRQNLNYAWIRDPQNMARSTLVLLEPLPPIDLIELTQELETYNWLLLYSLEASPDSVTWQERTSAMQWTGMMKFVAKYGVSVDIQVLRFIRSTLLFESMAARLDGEIDYVEQYQKFEDYRAEQARRRVTNSLLDQMDGIGNEQTIIRLDRIMHAAEGLLFRTSHMLTLPSVNFSSLMGKWSFAVYNLFRFIGHTTLLTLSFSILLNLIHYIDVHQFMNISNLLKVVVTNPVYQIILVILVFVQGRTVLFRLDDKEIAQ